MAIRAAGCIEKIQKQRKLCGNSMHPPYFVMPISAYGAGCIEIYRLFCIPSYLSIRQERNEDAKRKSTDKQRNQATLHP